MNVDIETPGSRDVARRLWYREPLVWMLIAIPGSSVVMAVVMITLAIGSYDGLVTDDYYKQGLQINQSLGRDRRAADLGMMARVDLGAGEVPTRISISSRSGRPSLDNVRLSLFHVTRQGQDVSVELKRISDWDFAGPPIELPVGSWHVQLETDEWRLNSRVRVPGADVILLKPSSER